MLHLALALFFALNGQISLFHGQVGVVDNYPSYQNCVTTHSGTIYTGDDTVLNNGDIDAPTCYRYVLTSWLDQHGPINVNIRFLGGKWDFTLGGQVYVKPAPDIF